MSNKILLFSRDPGGANTITPLVNPLKAKGYQVRLFGKDAALIRYEKAGLAGLDITRSIPNITLDAIDSFIQLEAPDFIITGTSADDFTEKFIWKVSTTRNIPCFAILDQWLNYGVRFSNYNLSELSHYAIDKIHPFLPTKILVMDDYAKDEILKEGLDRSKVIVTGHPYFELLVKTASSGESLDFRKKYSISESDFVLTYASEPISGMYGGDSDHYLGYTERTIFQHIVETLDDIIGQTKKAIVFVIKLHPKENVQKYDELIKLSGRNLNIIKDRDSDPWDVIRSSQAVCGMSSMFLIESVILNKPVISVQIGLSRENPFVLDRRGILKSVLTKEELSLSLRSIIIHGQRPTYRFEIIKNPINNVIRHMEKYLCQN